MGSMRPKGSSLLLSTSKPLPLAVEGFSLVRKEVDRSEREVLHSPTVRADDLPSATAKPNAVANQLVCWSRQKNR